jgi:hypothetical protein
VDQQNHPHPDAPQADPHASSRIEQPPPQTASSDAPMDRRVLLGFAGLAGVAALAKLAQAGPLEPPQGPISPTGVTLSELNAKASEASQGIQALSHKVAFTDQGVSEPRTPLAACAAPPGSDCLYRITQPGAYCMTENVVQTQGVSCCVSIECDGVDLDCQGFTFIGSGNAASPPSSCVRASGRVDIEVYDCAFRGWQGCPLDCDDCDDCYFSDILCVGCTCPPSTASDGTLQQGAMIRCRDRCECDDISISACGGCTVRVRDNSCVCDLTVCDSVGCACFCRNACCVESVAVLNGNVLIGGMIVCGDDCSLCDFEARHCTCPAGAYVSGRRCTCDDGCFTLISGDCVVCDDDCCVSDVQVSSCTGRGIQARTGACVEDVSFHNQQGDCVTVLDNGAVCDIECRACTGVAITCGAGACVEEVAISSHTGDCVRCADGSCVTETECRNIIGIAVSVGRSSLIEDCDVSGGGRAPTGGGAYRCGDGSCVRRSRSASRDDSMDIAVADNCSVEDCTVVRGQGIRCGADCCISDNRLSACSGGPDTTAGMGGAIVVMGPHCSVEENQLTDCRIAISVQGGAHFCSVDDNHVSATIGGIAGGVVAGIVVAAAVDRVMCTCNHLRVPAGAVPFIPGSSSYGPLVTLQPLGGDITLNAGSAHHLANFIIS